MPEKAIDPNDIATSQINKLILGRAGAFEGTPAEGLTQTVLAHSSTNAGLSETMMVALGGATDVPATGKEYPLIVRLTGKFKTAFPNGKPAVEPNPADPEKKEEPKAEAQLKESKEDSVVVLFGDADMLYDTFYAQIRSIFGQRMIVDTHSQNLPLLQNLVEFLSGDKDLISMRSRGTIQRPFVKIREMEAQAEKRYVAKITEMEKSVSELNAKLSELARGTEAGPNGMKTIMLSDVKKEYDAVNKQKSEASASLKLEKKNLRREVDSLQNTVQWANILSMPLLISIAGIGLALLKRQKTAAR